jgi:hypothetical protein
VRVRVTILLDTLAAVNAPLHPDKAFYLLPSSWYLLLRHLAYPEDYPPPRVLPSAAAKLSNPEARFLKSPQPAHTLLDRMGPFASGNPFHGTCQPEGRTHEFKLLPNLVEFRETGRKGKDVAEEPEGDVVFVEESGWDKIIEWSVSFRYSDRCLFRIVLSLRRSIGSVMNVRRRLRSGGLSFLTLTAISRSSSIPSCSSSSACFRLPQHRPISLPTANPSDSPSPQLLRPLNCTKRCGKRSSLTGNPRKTCEPDFGRYKSTRISWLKHKLRSSRPRGLTHP